MQNFSLNDNTYVSREITRKGYTVKHFVPILTL